MQDGMEDSYAVRLDKDLMDLLERYENDQGVSREVLQGMYALAADLEGRAEQDDMQKIYQARARDLATLSVHSLRSAPKISVRPLSPKELKTKMKEEGVA